MRTAGLHRPAALALAALFSTAAGCSETRVDDLWAFGAKKEVEVLATIRLARTEAAGELVGETLVDVQAFSSDADNLAVPLARVGQRPAASQRLAVSGTSVSVPMTVLLPVQLQPSAQGEYALHFVGSLVTGGGDRWATTDAARRAEVEPTLDTSRLDALATGIRVDTGADVNEVELSLASSLAFQFVSGQLVSLDNPAAKDAYRGALALVARAQGGVESALGAPRDVPAATYLRAVGAALRAHLVADGDLQAQIATIAVDLGQLASSAEAGARLSQFAQLVAGWAQGALDVLGQLPPGLVPSGFAEGAAAAAAAPSQAASLTPAAAFTDVDPTANIAGRLTIQPPRVTGSIDGYRVYLGGATLEGGRTVFVGRAAATVAPALDIASRPLPAGAGYLWIWPSVGDRELACPLRLAVKNLQNGAQGGTPDPQLKPPAGGLQVVRARNGFIDVAWAAVAGASDYCLYIHPGADLGADTPASVMVPPFLTYRLAGLTNAQIYALAIASVGPAGVGPKSNVVTATPQEVAPPAPANPRMAAVGDRALTVAWDPVADAEGYAVYWTAGAPVIKVDTNRELSASATFEHLSLSNGTTYRYAVAAIVEGVEGPLSAEVAGTPMPPFLGSPIELAAVTTADTSVALSWTPVPTADSYLVYAAPISPVPLDPPLMPPVVTTGASLVLADFAPGEIRFLRVVAARGAARSDASVEVRAMAGPLPNLVSGATAKFVVGQAAPDEHVVGGSDDLFGGAGSPAGVTLSHTNTLFASDPANFRVLGFIPLPVTSGAGASIGVNAEHAYGWGVRDSGYLGLASPAGLSANGGGLVVAGAGMQYAAYYGALPTQNETSFNAVIGADTPSLPDPARALDGSATLNPWGPYLFGGRLLIADPDMHRVAIYTPYRGDHFPSASVVLGQADKTHHARNRGVSDPGGATLASPSSVWTDGRRLLVYDAGNNRVLGWSTFPTQDGQAADFVLGQVDTGASVAYGSGANPVSAAGLNQGTHPTLPHRPGVASNGTQVAVSDPGNHRVLVWNTFPTTSHMPADVILGQATASAKVSPASPDAGTLHTPHALYMDTKRLLVADAQFSRIMVYTQLPPI